MIGSKLKRGMLVGLGALVVPVGISVVGAAPASAGPEFCVTGPYGYASACVEGPGWIRPWHDGPRWHGDHRHDHRHD